MQVNKKIIALLAMIIMVAGTLYTFYDFIRTKKEVATMERAFAKQNEKVAQKGIDLVRRKAINILLVLLLLVIVGIMSWVCNRFANRQQLWVLAIVYSVALLMAIIGIWYFEVHFSTTSKQDNILRNAEDLERLADEHKKYYSTLNLPTYRPVPLGFLMYSASVPNNEEFQFNAYAWLKYDKATRQEGKLGEFFVSNDEKHFTSDVTIEGNTEILGWDARVTLPVNFNLKKYPFDQQDIVLRFYHPQFTKHIVFYPDFAAYQGSTLQHPELIENLRISKWKIKNAYFFYQLSNYQTNFGITNYIQQKNYPYLSYAIELQRDYVDPLLSNLIPIIIILFILFGILLILPKVDMSLGSILGLLSGAFFSTIIAYQTFSRIVDTPELTYFQCFYFIIYFVTFLVTVNCLLFFYRGKDSFINYEQNLIPRLLYWPTVSTLFFVVTLLFFY